MEQRESKWTAQGSSWTNPGWCEMEATCWFKHCYGQYLHQKPHKITGVSQNQYFKWTQLWVGWFRSKIWVTVTYERGDWVWRRNVSILIIANLYYKANMEILKKFSPQGQKVIIFCAPKCLKKKSWKHFKENNNKVHPSTDTRRMFFWSHWLLPRLSSLLS